jgi:hypothetical protein
VLATEYFSRPSDIIGIGDRWAAYQFDLAVLGLARHVEKELNNKKPLERILQDQPRSATVQSQQSSYSSFRQLGPIRTMKIPENGVW